MADFTFDGEFTTTSQYVTQSIVLNNGNVNRATVQVNTAALLPDSTGFLFFLSNDGGSTWEDCDLGVEHVFSTTGQDVRLKVLANAGSTLQVRQSDGADYPIIVTYT